MDAGVMDAGDFGRRLRAARLARGWSQLALATDVEVAPRHVSDWERGKVDPRLSTVVRLAAALEVRVAALVEEDR